MKPPFKKIKRVEFQTFASPNYFFLLNISAYHLSYRQKVISIAALETFAE